MKEAMEQVKEELGRDAVILHTKKYREGGFMGYKGKEVVEVTAAIEENAPESPVKSRPRRSLHAEPEFYVLDRALAYRSVNLVVDTVESVCGVMSPYAAMARRVTTTV